jgi:hypothetical protein
MRFFVSLMLLAIMISGGAAADDRHAGYYYPEPESIETYISRAQPLPIAEKRQRIGFVVGFTQAMLARPYAPPFAIFVKGDDAEKMVIVSTQDGRLNTVYRARALLAQLTSTARTMPMFKELKVEDIFTFLDFLKLMGFTQITVSDGDGFAHQIVIR